MAFKKGTDTRAYEVRVLLQCCDTAVTLLLQCCYSVLALM
jgi:hypothetical protein